MPKTHEDDFYYSFGISCQICRETFFWESEMWGGSEQICEGCAEEKYGPDGYHWKDND